MEQPISILEKRLSGLTLGGALAFIGGGISFLLVMFAGLDEFDRPWDDYWAELARHVENDFGLMAAGLFFAGLGGVGLVILVWSLFGPIRADVPEKRPNVGMRTTWFSLGVALGGFGGILALILLPYTGLFSFNRTDEEYWEALAAHPAELVMGLLSAALALLGIAILTRAVFGLPQDHEPEIAEHRFQDLKGKEPPRET